MADRDLRRRSLFALVVFAAAVCLALIESWLGFGMICLALALALHLRPDASTWGRVRRIRARRSSPPPAE